SKILLREAAECISTRARTIFCKRTHDGMISATEMVCLCARTNTTGVPRRMPPYHTAWQGYGTRQAEAHWPIGTRPAGKQRTVPGGNVSGGRNLYSTGSLFPTTCTEVPGESGGATARVVGRSNGTDHLLPDSAEAASILGAEYAGWLIHAGLQIYYKFLKAAHQSCAAHLIRRCRDLAE